MVRRAIGTVAHGLSMARLPSGLYEQVVSIAVATELTALGEKQVAQTAPIVAGEAEAMLARYFHEVLFEGLTYMRDNFGEEDAVSQQVSVCNRLIEHLSELTHETDLLDWRISERHEQLLAIVDNARNILPHTHGKRTELVRPETPLSMSTLFTGSIHEPSMVGELKKEILTADRIDLLVSFIKWSGLRLILPELKAFTERGSLRVITTSYMGATDLKAMLELAKLPRTEIRISYDTRSTRLHAKSYVFYRETGFSTAYVGSSNLSNAAIGSGLEWNVKVTERDMPHVLRSISATFATYWHDGDFRHFTTGSADELSQALRIERGADARDEQYFFTVTPYAFQKDILDKLAAERQLHQRYRNLVIAATGTGKTVVSAFDYQRFCQEAGGKAARLLYVAHRREILEQSLKCFRAILRDHNFGELFCGDMRPGHYDHLFMSIQTFNSQDFANATEPGYYDFIIVDEFHHAAAPSYQALLAYYRPKVLLGLTATPERMDGIDIVGQYFGGAIAAEIRLPEAINRQLLSPFQYFGVSDNVDISQVRFERGRYDTAELTNVYTGNDMRTDGILRAVRRYVADVRETRGLGFCVSVEHAKYMARKFSEKGIPSLAVHGDSSREERSMAQSRLVNKEVHFLFTVDLYNEGVDIPEVDTVLFLRPTESLTVFLQQLGRGLRRCAGKDVLTVLDFIGQAHKQYSFEWKFRAMMGQTRRSVQKEIEDGFSALPRGCYIELERVAKETVLENIRQATTNKVGILRRLRTFTQDTGEELSLGAFLRAYSAITPRDIYRTGSTFAGLYAQAKGLQSPYGQGAGQVEKGIAKALQKLSRKNSRRLLKFLLNALTLGLPERLTAEEELMLRMFHYVRWQRTPRAMGFDTARHSFIALKEHEFLCEELCELLRYCYEQLSFVDKPVLLKFPCPLDLHCSYSRDDVMAAMGVWTDDVRPDMREGVKWLPEKKTDLLFINLNKTEKDFSPTTMYEDYAINERLFHWQSQSTTSATSPTGQRYIKHAEEGSQVLLFAREFKYAANSTDEAEPYVFLGRASYVSHMGSRPMSIIWRLAEPLPASMVSKAIQAGIV